MNDIKEPSPAEATDKLTPETPAKRKTKITVSLSEAVMLSVIVALLTIFCYDRFLAQKVMVADLDGLSKNLGVAVEQKVITIDQALTKLDEAKTLVDKAAKRNVVILSSVVLGNRDKYTFIDLPYVEVPQVAGQKPGAAIDGK
jgi:hypothetical protein